MAARIIGKSIDGAVIYQGSEAERLAMTDVVDIGARIFKHPGVAGGWESNGAGGWNQISIGSSESMDGLSTLMLANATATGWAASTQLVPPLKSKCVYMATLGGNAGIAVTATVMVYGSLVPMATATASDKKPLLNPALTLSGTGSVNNATSIATDSVAVGEHYYPYIWMEVTAINGAGANVITGRRNT